MHARRTGMDGMDHVVLGRLRAALLVATALGAPAACGDPPASTSSSLPVSTASPTSAMSPVSDGAPFVVLAEEIGVVGAPSLAVPDDEADVERWWAGLGVDAAAPGVDPSRDVLIGATAAYRSGCDFRFRDLAVDQRARTMLVRYTGSEPADSCGHEEVPFATLLAVPRADLVPGRWTVTASVHGERASFAVP